MKKNKTGVLYNISWKFAERISAQSVTFLVSIILARLLEPSDYGVISIVMIFISIANVFVSDGFGTALIQKKNADIIDFSSVLYFNIIFSIIVYTVLYILAPHIASFYGEGYEIISPVLRVLGIRIIVSAINSVQQAYVSRCMIFEKFFWSTLFGTIISAVVGVTLAYRGCGVWALVAQYLTNTMVDTCVLQIVLNKWPIKKMSFQRLKNLINYGYKILLTNLIITGYQELRALIIGKLYSSSDLAYYDKGKQFPSLLVTNINTSISAVLFPKMSLEQDNPEKVKEITRLAIRYSAFLLSPLILGLASVAKQIVIIILTPKWLPCVNLLQWFCVFYLFQATQTANTQAIKALGRSDLALKMEIIRDIIQLIVLILIMRINVDAIVISMSILSIFFVLINAYPNVKLLNYSLKEQMSDLLPPIVCAGIMAIIVYYVGFLHLPIVIMLFVQIIVGAVVYISLSILSRNKEFIFVINQMRKLKK